MRGRSEIRPSIAIQNSFPNWRNTAELEFTLRLKLCAQRLSIDARVVECSDDVLASGAEFLISLHEASPKLTSVTTLGAMWNPPSGIRPDPTRCDFVASYDGYLSASPSVNQFIKDQAKRFAGPPKPVAAFRFFPTSPTRIAEATTHKSLAYLGVHWDGARHGNLLEGLAGEGLVSLYGPQNAWQHAGAAYRGAIPFDGVSVIRRLADHGIVLCLHREPHVAEDTPSMRLFEAASAGCLIISDGIPFAREMFGDSIFILPDNEGRAEFVRETLAWAKAKPREARDMARASRAIFERHCSLDVLLPKVVEFGRTVKNNVKRRPISSYLHWITERIDVIYVLDGMAEGGADYAVATVNAQTHSHVRLVLVESEAAHAAKLTERPRFGVKVERVDAGERDLTSRGTLARHVASRFVTILNPDASWAPNHLASLLLTLRANPHGEIACAGNVLVARPGIYVSAPNLVGDCNREIKENRVLNRASGTVGCPSAMLAYPRGLMVRGNWLMRNRSFRLKDCGGEGDLSSVTQQTLHTGHVTAFSFCVAEEDLEPTVFV